MKKLLFVSYCSLFSLFSFAQGTIKGIVKDKESGEELFGASIGIAAISMGASTDFDGAYTIENVPAGKHKFECRYISYKTEVREIEVKDGETLTINFDMGIEGTEIEVLDVRIRVQKNSENSITMMQRKEVAVMDGVSAEQFAKTGSSNAAAAAKKVSGVTVQGGKYVFVRGLGDRYSKTLVNGAEIPGLDPNKNSVQMDMFPTDLLDNMLIFKTFQAEKPGDYTGGLVDVTTKSYPDKFMLSASTSIGFNPNAHFNSNFMTYDNTKNTIPDLVAGKEVLPNSSLGSTDESIGNQVTANTKSFDNQMDFSTKTNPFNYSQNLTIGNSKELNDSLSIGFVASLTYGKSYKAFYDGINARWQLTEASTGNAKLNIQKFYNDNQGVEEDNLGSLLSVTLKSKEKTEISMNLMYNTLNQKEARYLYGQFPQNDPTLTYYTRSLLNDYNKLGIAQLTGKHEFEKSKLNWVTSFSASSQEQPDLRFFTYGDYIDDGDTLSKVDVSIGQLPTRYFRKMRQTNIDNKVHYSKQVKENDQFKAGLSATLINRVFREEQFRYGNDLLAFDQSIEGYINNAWTYGNTGGVYIISAFDKRNNFDASQKVFSGYAQYKKQFDKVSTLIGGLRAEKTDIKLVSFDDEVGEANLNNLDFLPSLTYIRTLTEDSKIKTAATRTLARPTFRELAPYGSFQFAGQELLVGNPNLKRTIINNFDFRAEKFGKGGELVALGAFAKVFTNPIERISNPVAANTEINFVNIDKAFLTGIEFEWKKKIKQLSDSNKIVSAGINASGIYSRINLAEDVYTSILALDPSAKSYRPMFGQAPYTFNAIISYRHFDKKIKANLNFNISGPKMFLVMKGATPNVFEKSRADLSFNVSKEIKKHWKVKFKIDNILNSAYRYEQDFQGISYTFGSYKRGATVGFSLTYKI